jgi:phasin family protein
MLQCKSTAPARVAPTILEPLMPTKSKKPSVTVASVVPESLPLPVPEGAPAAFSLDSLTDLGRENMEAVARANLALSEGLKAISEEIFTYAFSTLESASQTATALLGAKTLDEVLQLNSELAKSSFETLVTRSAKLSEMGVNVASGTFKPLGTRFEATFVKFAKPAAA